jgi:hypothetical protein
MRRSAALWIILALAAVDACSDAGQDAEDPCGAWKDAALRYSLCSPALVVSHSPDETCIDDVQVAERWPQHGSVQECAAYLDSLIGTCDGLEVSREAVRVGDDTVVFDWIDRHGRRPSCTCKPLPADYSCSDLVEPVDSID